MYYRQEIDRLGAPTLGAKWYEKLWTGVSSAGSSALDIYGKSKQTEAYKDILSKITGQTVDYSKYIIIGSAAIVAVVILTRKKK